MRIERNVATKPAIHLYDILLADTELSRDEGHLLRMQVAIVERTDAILRLAQIEEQFFLIGGGAHSHQGPGAQYVLVDGCLDPPHRIGREAKPLGRLET